MTAIATIEAPDTTAIESEGSQIVGRANAIVIRSEPEYSAAAELLRSIKTLRKRISDTFGPVKRAIDAAKRSVLDQEARHDGPLSLAESTIKSKALAWQTEQDRICREQELAAQEAARKAESKRIAAEVAALRKAGEKEAAAALKAEPIATPTVVIAKPPAPKGISTRKVWRFRIADAAALPREYLTVDEKKIGAVVRALGGQTRIAGVEVYEEAVMSAAGF